MNVLCVRDMPVTDEHFGAGIEELFTAHVARSSHVSICLSVTRIVHHHSLPCGLVKQCSLLPHMQVKDHPVKNASQKSPGAAILAKEPRSLFAFIIVAPSSDDMTVFFFSLSLSLSVCLSIG